MSAVRGNPHAAFDAAGAGNVAWSRWCDTRRRKSEPTGNTNFDLNRRASPRPYHVDTGRPLCAKSGHCPKPCGKAQIDPELPFTLNPMKGR